MLAAFPHSRGLWSLLGLLDRRDGGLNAVEPSHVVLHFLDSSRSRVAFQDSPPCLDFPQLGKHRLQGVVTLFQFPPETSEPRLLLTKLLDTRSIAAISPAKSLPGSDSTARNRSGLRENARHAGPYAVSNIGAVMTCKRQVSRYWQIRAVLIRVARRGDSHNGETTRRRRAG